MPDDSLYFGLWSARDIDRAATLLKQAGAGFQTGQYQATEELAKQCGAWDATASNPNVTYELWIAHADAGIAKKEIAKAFPERKIVLRVRQKVYLYDRKTYRRYNAINSLFAVYAAGVLASIYLNVTPAIFGVWFFPIVLGAMAAVLYVTRGVKALPPKEADKYKANKNVNSETVKSA